MIISNKTEIYTRKKNNKKQVDSVLDKYKALSNSMLLVKTKRDINWLHYSGVTPQAIIKRFKYIVARDLNEIINPQEVIDQQDIQEDNLIGQIVDKKYTTKEELDGFPYQHYPLIKQYVDKYTSDLCSRKTRFIIQDKDNIALSLYINEKLPTHFDNEDFLSTKSNILKDQLIKGVGVARTRIYDVSKECERATFVKDKSGTTKIKKIKYNNKIKEGIELEYLDIDNLVYDPLDKKLNEFFIINNYSKEEFAQYFGNIFTEKEIEELTNKNIEVINYKRGEVLKFLYDSHEQGEYENDLFNSSLGYSRLSSCRSFNGLMSNPAITQTLNKTQMKNGNIIRVLEYYNIIDRKYKVIVGDELIYDDIMIEPFDHHPLVLFRYRDSPTPEWNSDSLASDLLNYELKLNDLENQIYKGYKASLVNIIEIREEKLQNPNEQIDLETITVIRSKIPSNSDGDFPADADLLKQNPIQINGLQLSNDMFNRIVSLIEKRFPDVQTLNSQMPRELIQEVLYTSHLELNTILQTNQISYSALARKLLISNMFFDYYNNNNGFVGELKDTKDKYAVYFVFSEEEVEPKKVQLNKLVDQMNRALQEDAKTSLLKNPEFIAKLEETQAIAIKQLQEFNDKKNSENLVADEEAIKKASETYLKAIRDRMIAEQSVLAVQPIDTSKIIIVPIDNYMDLKDNKNLIKINYDETPKETMNKLIRAGDLVKQFNLPYNFEEETIMGMISYASGFDKNIYQRYELSQTAQVRRQEQIRLNTLIQDSPVAESAIFDHLGIKHDKAAMIKYRYRKDVERNEVSTDVAKIKRGLIRESMISESDVFNLKNPFIDNAEKIEEPNAETKVEEEINPNMNETISENKEI